MEEHQPKYRYKGDIMTALDLHTQDWEDSKVQSFGTFEECVQNVSEAFGEAYVGDFDVDAIARRVWHWNPQLNAFINDVSSEEFWAIAEEHDSTLK